VHLKKTGAAAGVHPEQNLRHHSSNAMLGRS